MQRKGTSSKQFKRSGLHKLECECGNYVYATVASLEKFGLPICPCDERFAPDELELSMMLGVDSPAVDEYRREMSSVIKGQASHIQRGRTVQAPEAIAAERVAMSRKLRARSNRLQALMPAVEMPF